MRKLLRILPVVGVLCLLASFGWTLQQRSYANIISLILAAVGIFFFSTIFIRPQMPNLRQNINTGLYVIFALSSCVIVYVLVARHDRAYDITARKMHTLSEGTHKFLRLLKKDVDIVVFDVDDRPYRELLEKFAALSSHVRWSLHDPRKDPIFTRSFDPTVADKTIYIRHGEKKKRISEAEFDEAALTNGIVEVTREREVKVYFMQGHGELALQSNADSVSASAAVLKDFLAGRAMHVEPLNLVERAFVPKDATLIILAGPTQDLYPVEARQLEQFLDQGGRLLVFFDLPTATGQAIEYTNLVQLLHNRGLEDHDAVIVDMQGKRLLDHPLKVPVLWTNSEHEITEPLARTSGPPMGLTLVRSLSTDKIILGYKIVPLVGSSPEAWAEPFLNLGKKINAPTAMNRQTVAWAIESVPSGERGPARQAATGMRMVVFGTSEPIRDNFITTSNVGVTLTLNTINWLIAQDDLIPVPPPFIPGTPMILSELELRAVMILVVMAFPSLIFFGGVMYARMRRN